jgi:hypothetical protein
LGLGELFVSLDSLLLIRSLHTFAINVGSDHSRYGRQIPSNSGLLSAAPPAEAFHSADAV